jgi:ankyrin repeat protein
MRFLVPLTFAVSGIAAQPAPEAARKAVEHAMPLLERSAAAFVSKRACVSCHHNILPILVFHLAAERGVASNQTLLGEIENKSFRELRGAKALDDAVQSATLNDPTPNDGFLLMAAGAAGLPGDLVTGIYARRLIGWQRGGHWITSDFRPPHSSSMFTATATAIHAIRLYLPEELRGEGDRSIREARAWLLASVPASTEDAAFRVLGMVWAGAPPDEVRVAQKDLLGFEQRAGGWSELPGYPQDPYSTGEALFALHESGMPVEQAAWQRGMRMLIGMQKADGSWHVRTRMLSPAQVSPEYFATGFPYGKDEYLSYAASCWAVLALLETVPESERRPAILDAAQKSEVPSWARTALFGTTSELATLLESGLDPNSRTGNGTTLLMMAAPDAAKVRLLLSRGADAKARANSGGDALTAAAAYRGTAASISALLAAGSPVQPEAGVRPHCSPLVFAAMTGDFENTKLLLAHGANPSASAGGNTPLTAALTFGYPDIAQALIAAGASATGVDSSGINLLHWAAITNRPAVIPLLAAAGVELNATDENGFTPLMYAATIDFGDIAVLQALLRAGADKTIPNADGRTPLEQARFFNHARIEAALR